MSYKPADEEKIKLLKLSFDPLMSIQFKEHSIHRLVYNTFIGFHYTRIYLTLTDIENRKKNVEIYTLLHRLLNNKQPSIAS